jgi:nucleoside-diphosphate-sugar epimerase
MDSVRALFDGVKPDVIFHLGGLVNAAPELRLVVPTFHSLAGSTVNLLTMAAESGCRRVVLVGSLEEPPIAQTKDLWPTSPYGAAKWVATTYGRMFHKLFDLPIVIARTFMAYGPGQPTCKLIPYTILSLLRGETPSLSSGQRRLDWVYVDDVVEGLLLAGSTPGLEGSTIELGSGMLTPIREIVTRLVTILRPAVAPGFHALPDRPRRRERAARIAETQARTGWTPTTPLDDGLARTVDWYRRNFDGPATNINVATRS